MRILHTLLQVYDDLAERGEQVVARRRFTPPPAPAPTKAPTPTRAEPTEIELALTSAPPGATLAHDELPLEDFDHLTLGSLRARLPRLDPVELIQLRDYERTHAHRLPVLTLLDNRLAKVGAQNT